MFTTARPETRLSGPVGFRAAFTLVELLVVIGIIAVLIGILLPTLGRAKQGANSIKCMANLRTIGTAIQLYAGQNKGMLPFGYYETNQPIDGNPTYKAPGSDWTLLLLSVLNKKGGNELEQDKTGIGDAGLRAIFLCPESYRPASGPAFITNYSAHPRILPHLQGQDLYRHVTPNPIPLLRTYPLSRYKQSSEKAVIFDASLSNTSFQAQAVAGQIDKRALGTRRPYLTDVYSLNPAVNGGQQVDLTPTSDNPADINRDSSANSGNFRFRHFKDSKMNALMLDGHVEAFSYNPQTKKSDVLRRNIYVTAPAK